MKKILAFVVLMACLTILVQGAYAEGTVRLPIQVPFEFFVDNTLLAAGDYKIEIAPAGSTGAFSLLVIYGGNGQACRSLFVRNQGDQNPDTASLRFNRYGKAHFLTVVSTGRNQVNLETSKAEKEMLARALTPTTILVAQK